LWSRNSAVRLASSEQIKTVASLVTEQKKAGKDVIVVVSAMGDTTDQLFRLARTISPKPPERELDMLLTAGERISMALLSMAISELGYEAISFTGSQSGIVTDTSHTRAKILDVRAFRVREELAKGRIVIVAGFQGVSSAKEVTTLGRGGSDTTCVALAAAFSARECEIFTDVDGVFTADPRLVPEARKIDRISYEEMLELSYCGAGVLHWRSVNVAKRFGVRIHVRSSFKKEMGTIVTARDEIETAEIRGIAQDLGLAKISVSDAKNPVVLADSMLGRLEESDITVRLLSIAPTGPDRGTVSVLIDRDRIEYARKSVAEALPDRSVEVDPDIATISVVGHGLCGRPGIAKRILASLDSLGIRPLLVATSGITITIAVGESEAVPALKKLHSDLELGSTTQGGERESDKR
jgi:aspartate kinase